MAPVARYNANTPVGSDQTTSTYHGGAYHERRQAVWLETVRLGDVVGWHDFLRSINFSDWPFCLAALAQMSSDHISKSKHWLDRAAEMRTFAASTPEDGIKASMLRLARDYDKLAARAIARGSAVGQNGDLPSTCYKNL